MTASELYNVGDGVVLLFIMTDWDGAGGVLCRWKRWRRK